MYHNTECDTESNARKKSINVTWNLPPRLRRYLWAIAYSEKIWSTVDLPLRLHLVIRLIFHLIQSVQSIYCSISLWKFTDWAYWYIWIPIWGHPIRATIGTYGFRYENILLQPALVYMGPNMRTPYYTHHWYIWGPIWGHLFCITN